MFEMERKYAIRKNHLDAQQEVYPRMRTVLLDWISEVHTQYHFAQETFHIAVSTIDRYLQVSEKNSLNIFLFESEAILILFQVSVVQHEICSFHCIQNILTQFEIRINHNILVHFIFNRLLNRHHERIFN